MKQKKRTSGRNAKKALAGIIMIAVIALMVGMFVCRDDIRDFVEPGLERQLEEKHKKDALLSYDENGVAETVTGEEVETSDEDFLFSKCYNAAGDLIWDGISEEAFLNLSQKEKDAYLQAYTVFQETVLSDMEMVADELSEDTVLQVDSSQSIADRISTLCVEYNKKIPFNDGGRSYAKGFFKQDTYDNSAYQPGNGYGLDSKGYLIWLFRNALGYTPDGLKDGKNIREHAKPVTQNNLQVGDICFLYEPEATTSNLCGVVAGFLDGDVVVSVCDNYQTEDFPYGSTHFVFIAGQKDSCLDVYPPVHFQAFYRLTDLMED